MSEERKIKIGDRVKIKGHSVPLMTVSSISTNMLGETSISVIWFTDRLELKEASGLHSDMFTFID